MNKDEKKKPKLVLRKESLRQLNTKDLAKVQGNSEEVPESGTTDTKVRKANLQ